MSTLTEQDVIFVSGGTGTQGFATIRHILNFQSRNTPICIHALVRDPDSPNAQKLASLSPSVKLFKGDNDDCSAIAVAAESCTACFFVLLTGWNDAKAEKRHATNILTVLSSVPTMKRIVYTTTAGVKDPSVPGNFVNVEKGSLLYTYYQGKHANEMAVRKFAEQNGWTWTILKPATFLSNLLNPMAQFQYPDLAQHYIVSTVPANYKYCWTDPDDVGQISAAALLGSRTRPKLSNLSSQSIELASQVGTLRDAVAGMEKAITNQGMTVSIRIEYISIEEAEKRNLPTIKINNERFVAENPINTNLGFIKEFGFQLGTIEGFFEREVERVKEVLGFSTEYSMQKANPE